MLKAALDGLASVISTVANPHMRESEVEKSREVTLARFLGYARNDNWPTFGLFL